MPSEHPQAGRCGAKMRNSMERFGKQMYCNNIPERGRTRCKWHGGACLRGVEHPRYRGRGYSLDIPGNLAKKLERALDDPDLVSLGHEIALLDTRIGRIFQGMNALESETAFDRMKEAILSAEAAIVEDDLDEAMTQIKNAKKAMRAKAAERDGWNEIYGVIKERRQLVDTERKREEMLQGTMTARQVATLIAAIQTAILEEVHETTARRRLGQRLQFLLGLRTDEGPMNNEHVPNRRSTEFVNIDRGAFVKAVELANARDQES